MFAEEDELVVVAGPASPDEFVVRHMVGGRSDMLWLDSRNSFTSDHTMAKVMTEVEARIACEGQRVTYKEQHNYVFDMVAKDQVEVLLKAASLAIVKEAEERKAAKLTTGTTPLPAGASDPYERWDRYVRDGLYSVDEDGYYLDDDGERIRSAEFEGGEARQGYHNKDPNSPGNRPKDPNKFDVRAKLEGFSPDTSTTWHGDYGTIQRALGTQHSDPGDGWRTSSVWWIEFHDGEKVCVSDERQSSTYDDELPDPEQIRGGVFVDWKIEGSPGGVARIEAALRA